MSTMATASTTEVDHASPNEQVGDEDGEGNGGGFQRQFISLATWDREAQKSYVKAKSHFNTFCKAITKAASQVLFGKGSDYPMEFVKGGVRNLKLGVQVLDAFAMYLSCATRLGSKTAGNFLMRNTADRYLSALKIGLLRETTVKDHPWNNKERTTRVRNGMLNAIAKRNFVTNTPNIRPHIEATKQDMAVLAVACIFADTTDMYGFSSFTNSLYQFAGRSGEVAYCDWDKIELAAVPEFEFDERLAKVNVSRLKTYSEQDLSLFPHSQSFLHDWYFLMGSSMIVDPMPNEHMFPQFHDKTKTIEVPELPDFDATATQEEAMSMLSNRISQMVQEQSERPTESAAARESVDDSAGRTSSPAVRTQTASTAGAKKVAKKADKNDQQVSKLWKSMCSMAQKLVDSLEGLWDNEKAGVDVKLQLTPGLSSHSTKKHAVNTANESPGVQTRWLVDRCGWVWNSMHTLFDYLTRSNSNDRQVARALSGWKSTREGAINGGRPPRLSAIRFIGEAMAKDMGAESVDEDNDAERKELEEIPLAERNEDLTTSRQIANMLFCKYHKHFSMSEGDVTHFQELLFASILMYMEGFIRLLLSHPEKKFGSTVRDLFRKNRLLREICFVSSEFGVTPEKLRRWGQQVRFDFIQRNYQYLPIDVLREHPESLTRQPDTREIQSQINDIGKLASATAIQTLKLDESVTVLSSRSMVTEDQQQRLSQEIAGLRRDMSRLSRDMSGLSRDMSGLRHDMSRLIRAVSGGSGSAQLPLLEAASLPPRSEGQGESQSGEDGVGREREEPSQRLMPPAERVDMFPKQVGGQSVKELFVTWYRARLFEVFPHVQSPKSKRSVMKYAVELFTLFTPTHVPPLPVGHSTIAHRWQLEVMELANQGWASFEQFHAENAGQGRGRVPRLVEPFVKFMGQVADVWPVGPSGSIDESFQIPTTVGHKVEKMRGREKLLLDVMRKAQRKKDRKKKQTEAEREERRRRSESNTEG